VYTVDQHILAVLRNLRRFTMPEHAHEYPLASQLIAELDRHWLLYVAALYHDIAKGRGGDHSELGAREVRHFARDHALSAQDAELVEFLVQRHLCMSMVAQKRDLSDPKVIYDFATLVQDERHLTALYLLTVADIRGTNPKVWNAWKAKLLEDLYRLTLAALGNTQVNTHTLLSERKESATQLTRLAGVNDSARQEFWKQLDVAYFLRHEAADIAWHTQHLAHLSACVQPIVKAQPTAQAEGLQVLVYTPDVPDLFVRICAYFATHAMSIQDARIHTSQRGWALDSFIVLLPETAEDLSAHAKVVEHELVQHLTAAVAPQRHDPLPVRPSRIARMFPVMPQTELEPDENRKSWCLSITATDRPGLLHALAHVFARHKVNLRMAKVMTLGERVEDVFILDGATLAHARTQIQFERDIFDTLTDTESSACLA
jgi:[protein-PII] uridylyltransferase